MSLLFQLSPVFPHDDRGESPSGFHFEFMTMAAERVKDIFEKMERDVVKLSSNRQADRVHSFRTTARRLQILLKLLLPEQGRKQKKLLKSLNRIRKRAGKVRDVDVQIAALRSLKVPLQPRRKTQLTQELLESRAEHEESLKKLLSKSEVRDLRKLLRRAAKATKPESMRDPLGAANQLLRSVPADPSGNGIVNEAMLHHYRLAVKKARYAAEFAPKSAASAELISQLKRLQDSLGNWHDWLTLTSTAVQRIGEVNESPLVAALHNVTGGKFRNAVAALSTSPILHTAPEKAHPPKTPSKPRSKPAIKEAAA